MLKNVNPLIECTQYYCGRRWLLCGVLNRVGIYRTHLRTLTPFCTGILVLTGNITVAFGHNVWNLMVVIFKHYLRSTPCSRVRSQIRRYGICGGQSGTGIDFFPEYFGLPAHITPVLHSHVIRHRRCESYQLTVASSHKTVPVSNMRLVCGGKDPVLVPMSCLVFEALHCLKFISVEFPFRRERTSQTCKLIPVRRCDVLSCFVE